MTESEFLHKVDNGVVFTKTELKDIVFEDTKVKHIENISRGNRRWTESISTIVKADDRYFSIDWERGLTELQENYFLEQPYEVIKTEKVITVTEWVKKE